MRFLRFLGVSPETMAFGLMNNGFPVRNEFKFSGFDGKVYFLVINLNVFSSYIKKNILKF